MMEIERLIEQLRRVGGELDATQLHSFCFETEGVPRRLCPTAKKQELQLHSNM